jgi:hypothetical protein
MFLLSASAFSSPALLRSSTILCPNSDVVARRRLRGELSELDFGHPALGSFHHNGRSAVADVFGDRPVW